MHWLQQEEQAIQSRDWLQRGIDERRKWDEWERRKERAVEEIQAPSEHEGNNE